MSGLPVEIGVGGNLQLRGQQWDGGPVWTVLVHEPGVEHDLDDWRALIPYLLGSGSGVLAFDLRGHGASDGDRSISSTADDIASVVVWLRGWGVRQIVVIAAGASAVEAIRACEQTRIEGVIAVSPDDAGGEPPRGAGVAKLLFAAANAPGGLGAARAIKQASIGPALLVSLPVAQGGAALFSSELATTCREHVLAFLRERALEQSIGGWTAPAGDQFLKRLGITPKGAGE